MGGIWCPDRGDAGAARLVLGVLGREECEFHFGGRLLYVGVHVLQRVVHELL